MGVAITNIFPHLNSKARNRNGRVIELKYITKLLEQWFPTGRNFVS